MQLAQLLAAAFLAFTWRRSEYQVFACAISDMAEQSDAGMNVAEAISCFHWTHDQQAFDMVDQTADQLSSLTVSSFAEADMLQNTIARLLNSNDKTPPAHEFLSRVNVSWLEDYYQARFDEYFNAKGQNPFFTYFHATNEIYFCDVIASLANDSVSQCTSLKQAYIDSCQLCRNDYGAVVAETVRLWLRTRCQLVCELAADQEDVCGSVASDGMFDRSQMCERVFGESRASAKGYRFMDEFNMVTVGVSLLKAFPAFLGLRSRGFNENEFDLVVQLLQWSFDDIRYLLNPIKFQNWHIADNDLTYDSDEAAHLSESIKMAFQVLEQSAETSATVCEQFVAYANESQMASDDSSESFIDVTEALCMNFEQVAAVAKTKRDNLPLPNQKRPQPFQQMPMSAPANKVKLLHFRLFQRDLGIFRPEATIPPFTTFEFDLMFQLASKHNANVSTALTKVHLGVYPAGCIQHPLPVHTIGLGNGIVKAQARVETLVQNAGVYLFRFASFEANLSRTYVSPPYSGISNTLCQEILAFSKSDKAKGQGVFSGESDTEIYFGRLVTVLYRMGPDFNPNVPSIQAQPDFKLGTSFQASCHTVAYPQAAIKWYFAGVEVPQFVHPGDIVPVAILPPVDSLRNDDIGDQPAPSNDTAEIESEHITCRYQAAANMRDPEGMQVMMPQQCVANSTFLVPGFGRILNLTLRGDRCGQWWKPLRDSPYEAFDCPPFPILYARTSEDAGFTERSNYETTFGTFETLSTITFNSTTPLAKLVCCAALDASYSIETDDYPGYCKEIEYEVRNPIEITPDHEPIYEADRLQLSCNYVGFLPKVELPGQTISFLRMNLITFMRPDLDAKDYFGLGCTPQSDVLLSWQILDGNSGQYKVIGEATLSRANDISSPIKILRNATFEVELSPSSLDAHEITAAGSLRLSLANISDFILREGSKLICSARPVCSCGNGTLIDPEMVRGLTQCGRHFDLGAFKAPTYGVYTIEPRRIIPPHFEQAEKTVLLSDTDEDKTISLDCDSYSDPPADVVWLRDNRTLASTHINVSDNLQVQISVDKKQLKVIANASTVKGDYTCVASNNRGQRASMTYHVRTDAGKPVANAKTIIAVSTSAVLVVLGLLAVLAVVEMLRRRNRGKMLRELHDCYLKQLENEAQCELDPNLSLADQAIHLRYNPDFEIKPKSRLRFGDRIGKGQFGVVFSGSLLPEGANEEEGEELSIMVAIKRPKKYADQAQYKSLLQEITIMSRVGTHNNVIRFFGAVTENLFEGELYMVVEKCVCALNDFLESAAASQTDEAWSDNPEYPRLPLDSSDLLCLCAGIASGMSFLASRSIVHRDLAARNILLNSAFEPKVADYGLSREIDEGYYFIRNQLKYIPVRWMAMELLNPRTRKVSQMSDVWSFGVVLWEIFSLGALPYEQQLNLNDSYDSVETMYGYLSEGNRLLPPGDCPTRAYALMLSCWNTNPRQRPNFAECTAEIDAIINGDDASSTQADPHNCLENYGDLAGLLNGDVASASSSSLSGAIELQICNG